MGFEKNGAGLLLRLRAEGVQFGRVLTLGHQDVHLEPAEYRRFWECLGNPVPASRPRFADDLFRHLGATEVEAMDFSDYEGATLIHDLNRPVPPDLYQRYDTIFDGGTLEHIFDFPTAIRSCMQMLRLGGRFVGVTMPNNWCGHGFYQFSPELFYRVFNARNGFAMEAMYFADLRGRAFAVKDPDVVRSRVELCNEEPLYLLVHARRVSESEIFANPPQQSDYVDCWVQSAAPGAVSAVAGWKELPLIRQLRGCRASWHQVLGERRRRRMRSLRNETFYSPVELWP